MIPWCNDADGRKLPSHVSTCDNPLISVDTRWNLYKSPLYLSIFRYWVVISPHLWQHLLIPIIFFNFPWHQAPNIQLRPQAPSAVLRSGRASVTFLQRLQRTQLALSSACSLLAIRIGTGRRHQIRLHTAHVGHPVVADSQYAAKEVYRMDTRWCPRNFLHRCSLTFLGQGHESTTALEVLPMDLRQVLWTATWRDVELELDSPLGTAPEKGHLLRDPSGSCFCGTSLKYAGFLTWGYP